MIILYLQKSEIRGRVTSSQPLSCFASDSTHYKISVLQIIFSAISFQVPKDLLVIEWSLVYNYK